MSTGDQNGTGPGTTSSSVPSGTGLGTVRIEVELEKTGDDSFPEFSYVALTEELSGLNKKQTKKDKGTPKGKLFTV